MKKLRETIEFEGQKYLDDPIVVLHKPTPNPLGNELAGLFKRRLPQVIKEVTGHKRSRLNWIKSA